MSRPLLGAAVLRKLSVDAMCDPRTVSKVLRKALAGEAIEGGPGNRAKAALVAEGLIPAGFKFSDNPEGGVGFDVGTFSGDPS